MIDEKKLIEAFEELFKPQFNAYGDFGKYSKLNLIGILRIIEEQPKVGEWILVDEALPKENEEVMITTDDGEIVIANFSYKYHSFTNGVRHGNGETYWKTSNYWYTNDLHMKEVIAWQPLPKAYEVL